MTPARWSINFKIMAGFVLMVVSLGGSLTYTARYSLTGSISRQLDMRAATVAQSIATQTPDFLYAGDYYTLHELLLSSLENNDDIRYIFVLDGAGAVLASTFPGNLPPGLAEVNRLGPRDTRRLALFNTREGVVRDVAVPLPGGVEQGTVRVGVSEAAARQAVAATTGRLLLVISLVLLFGTVAAYGLVLALTRPLKRLLEVTRAFAEGDLSRRAGVSSQDEIGVLGAAFDHMADNLQNLLQELRRKETARALLLRKVISAQEEERKLVARELHDQIGQCFTSIAVGLRAIEHMEDPAEVRRHAEELRALANAAVKDVQHLSRMLRPSVLDDLGLAPALERATRDIAGKFGFEVALRLRGLEERLPVEVETAVYRIVQECLTNVGRHARATAVRVAVERREGAISAMVKDDGCGFDPKPLCDGGRFSPDRCLGLSGIQERATLLGGSLEVESRPGRGTRISVTIPLPSAKEGLERGKDQAVAG